MITFEDFLIKKEAIQGGGMYKHFEYDDPNGLFSSELNYDYKYGWGCKVYFPENPDVGIYFEDGSDYVQSVLDSLNTCIPFYNKIKNEEGESIGFILDDFDCTSEGHYEYKDKENKVILNVNYNGVDYCEASIFMGDLEDKNINVFFEQDNINHTLASLNQCLLTVIDMYNNIKDLKIEEAPEKNNI